MGSAWDRFSPTAVQVPPAPSAVDILLAADAQRQAWATEEGPAPQAIVASSAVERSANPLRPRYLDEMIGQERLRRLLRRVIDAALARNQPLDHVLLVGPAGTGKTTTANVIAAELGVSVYQVEAPVSKSTLLQLRDVMSDGDVLFLDEIAQQAKGGSEETAVEHLYHLLEDCTMPTAQGMVAFPKITVIGATTDEGELPRPLLDRFPLRPVIEPYSVVDLATIASHNAAALDLTMDTDAAEAIARAAGDVPRLVNSMVRNCGSLSTGHVDLGLAQEVIVDLNGRTLDGLSRDQQNYLRFLRTQGRFSKAAGGTIHQASMTTIATAIGKPRDPKGITQLVEPLLISRGLVQITNGGRRLSDAGLTRARDLR
jgi:Holliday junction DNA helicase RuvB